MMEPENNQETNQGSSSSPQEGPEDRAGEKSRLSQGSDSEEQDWSRVRLSCGSEPGGPDWNVVRVMGQNQENRIKVWSDRAVG